VFKETIPPIKFKSVLPKEIEGVNSLKMKDSYVYDGISTKILKQSIPYILLPLTYIGNLMISTGIFPTRLKFAEIKPLHKEGKIGNTSDYRPISLLISFLKFLKNYMYYTNSSSQPQPYFG
jgi:hypothetical protein